MNTTDIKSIIMRRASLDDENQVDIERCWNDLSNAISDNYDNARHFLLEDAKADDISWVSEVFDDIIEITQSRRYVDLLRQAIARFPKEDERFRMTQQLDEAVRVYYADDLNVPSETGACGK